MDSIERTAEAEVYTCSGRTVSSADPYIDKSPLRRTLRKYFENQPGVTVPAAAPTPFGSVDPGKAIYGNKDILNQSLSSARPVADSLTAQKDDL